MMAIFRQLTIRAGWREVVKCSQWLLLAGTAASVSEIGMLRQLRVKGVPYSNGSYGRGFPVRRLNVWIPATLN